MVAKGERDEAQQQSMAESEIYLAELRAADVVVVRLPMWNFGMPASLKAYFDLVCIAGETFNYTAEGPKGLLSGKRAVICLASGGVPKDSPVDFATPHARQVLRFIGISEQAVFFC